MRTEIIVDTTSFNSEQEAWLFLEESENKKPHSQGSPSFLYRGQTDRYFRQWPPEDIPADKPADSLEKFQFEFDSLIPSDYRGVEDIIATKGKSAVPKKSGDCASIFRSVLTYGCIAEHGESLSLKDHNEIMKWLDECVNGKHGEVFDAPGSVGQHYGFHTCYLDATSDLKVAFWFATRNQDSGEYIGSGHSVVYQIDLGIFKSCCDDFNAKNGFTGQKRVRCTDIRLTPPQLGQRAARQRGWSLMNFESPMFFYLLVQSKGIIAVTFPRTPGPCFENNLKKDYLLPSGENLTKIFDDVKAGNLFSLLRQHYIDERINNNPKCTACASYRINLIDPQWRGWLF
jgi:hypothetical protein